MRVPVWLLPFSLLAMAVVAVPVAVLEEAGLPRYRALRAELIEIQRHNGRLRREVRSLVRQVDALRKDPSEVELIARDQLGMVRRGEIVFQFPE